MSERKGVLLEASAPKRPRAKIRADRGKAGLVRRCVRRAAEQPAARQTRLATDRQHIHECRAAEQFEARQARLERLARKTV